MLYINKVFSSFTVHVLLYIFNLVLSVYYHSKIMYLIKYFSLSCPSHSLHMKWLGNVDYTAISTSFPLIIFPYFYHLTHIFTRTLNTLIPIIKRSQIVKSNGHFSIYTIFRVLGACFPGDIHLLLSIISLHLVDINFPGFIITSIPALFLLS